MRIFIDTFGGPHHSSEILGAYGASVEISIWDSGADWAGELVDRYRRESYSSGTVPVQEVSSEEGNTRLAQLLRSDCLSKTHRLGTVEATIQRMDSISGLPAGLYSQTQIRLKAWQVHLIILPMGLAR